MNLTETNHNGLATAVDFLVNNHVGIISHLQEVRGQAGEPEFFHYYSKACNTQAFSQQTNFVEAGGASAHRSVAMAKAIGEAVERYCSAIFWKEDFPLEPYSTASFKCIHPDEFALYSDEQLMQPGFPYVPFLARTPIRWTQTVDSSSGEIWHVPASMVYLPYLYDAELGEAAIAQSISTGLACHTSKTGAAISALCEVIERDAFTITWQAMLQACPVHVDSLSEDNQDLVRRFEMTGGTVRILNLTLDHGIPAILTILMHLSEELPAFVFSASAHLNPEVAVRKSLEELAHTRRLGVELKHQNHQPTRKQDAHVKLYTNPVSQPAVEFLLKSDDWIDFTKLPNLSSGDADEDLAIISQRISAAGFKPLLKDVTTPDIEGLGLCVVRAVIPGFHPLFMGHHVRALGGWRLWNIPQQLGYVGISKEAGDNPAPHPFP